MPQSAAGQLRAHKREELLAATENNLGPIKARVDAGQARGRRCDRRARGQGGQPVQGRQALRAGHRRGAASPSSASARASPPRPRWTASTSSAPRCAAAHMDAAECVRNYKALANVERAFRSLKTVDLKVRPIHHRTADRVRAHIFLCMLAYYVEWHMREAWRELMFADTIRRPRPRAIRWRRPALASRAGQGRQPHARRRHAGTQLLDPARRTRHHRAQHLPHAQRRARCADVRHPHHAQRQATPRARSDQADPTVDRNRNPDLTPSTCDAKTNSLWRSARTSG